MAFQLNNNQGSLFLNQYKTNDPTDRRPHYKGHCLINGVPMDVAAWLATPQNGGAPYLQLKFEAPRQQQQPQQGYAQPMQGMQPQGYPQAAPAYPQYQQQRQPAYQQPMQRQPMPTPPMPMPNAPAAAPQQPVQQAPQQHTAPQNDAPMPCDSQEDLPMF